MRARGRSVLVLVFLTLIACESGRGDGGSADTAGADVPGGGGGGGRDVLEGGPDDAAVGSDGRAADDARQVATDTGSQGGDAGGQGGDTGGQGGDTGGQGGDTGGQSADTGGDAGSQGGDDASQGGDTGGGNQDPCEGLPGVADLPAPEPLRVWGWEELGVRLPEGVTRTSVAVAWQEHRGTLLAVDHASGTWEWSPADGWAQRAALGETPVTGVTDVPPRAVYDPTDARVLVFGGDTNTVWAWDGAAWSTHPAGAGAAPFARTRHDMVWDPAAARLLVFGGESEDGATLNDLWAWDDDGWTSLASQPTPGPVYDHAMVWDRAGGQLVLFRGASGETWTWRDGVWTDTGARAPFDRGRYRAALAYDALGDRVVMVGGERTQAWEHEHPWVLDLAGGAWVDVDTGDAGPRSKVQGQLVWDDAGARFLLFIRSGLGWGGFWQLREDDVPNRAPAIAADFARSYRLWPGDPLAVTLPATDADGHALRYVAVDLPPGATFDAETGALAWTPNMEQAGTYAFTLGVTDGALCDRELVTVEVVDPHYPTFPEGEYAAFKGRVTVPVQYIEERQDGTEIVFEVEDSHLTCTILGRNPGKLTLYCVVSYQQAWYSGGIGSEIWTQWTGRLGMVPVEPDGSFVLRAGGTAGRWDGHQRYPLPEDVAAAGPIVSCPAATGRLERLADGQLGLTVVEFTTRCRRDGIEDGAVATFDEPPTSELDLEGFHGSYGHGEDLQPNVPMEGYALGGVMFWHPTQQVYYQVDGPLWYETGGLIKDLDGNLLATAGHPIPRLDPAITWIGNDETGALAVER